MSPSSSAAPITVLSSTGKVGGKSNAVNSLTSISTKRQQLPSAFSAKR